MRLLIASFIAMLPLFLLLVYVPILGDNNSAVIRVVELALIVLLSGFGYFFTAKRLSVEEISLTLNLASTQVRRLRSKK